MPREGHPDAIRVVGERKKVSLRSHVAAILGLTGSSVGLTLYFTPDLFRFLNELKKNNNREWFNANKARYHNDVQGPFLKFIADFGPALHAISPHFVADPNPVGGSMMRIYRDIRFSKDKSPYKTAVAAHFWHEKGKEGASPAFYLHLEPGKSSIGSGIWHPEPGALSKVRKSIARRPEEWKRATTASDFRSLFEMGGESLKRPPAGYDPNHAWIEDLKRKDFVAGTPLRDDEVRSVHFQEIVLDRLRVLKAYTEFLTKAIGLRF